jgi:hypothetical protein
MRNKGLYSFFNLGARLWVGDQCHAWLLYPREIDPVPIVQGTGWIPASVWRGAYYLAPTGIRSLKRPALRELLYRLSYRGTK